MPRKGCGGSHAGGSRARAGRSGAIVKNLLIFARRSGVELALHGINAVMERAAMLVRHHLEMANVTLEATPLDGDDTLVCDSDQLEQALVALLVNAVEAMPNGGLLRLAAAAENDSIVLTVADTGVGVPDDAVEQRFLEHVLPSWASPDLKMRLAALLAKK